jgi:rubrerythrin
MKMNIFEFAKKMEVDGKSRYEKQYSVETNQGIKEILKLLISQEQEHYNILDKIEKSKDFKNYERASFAGVKNLFEEMKDELDLVSKDSVKFYKTILEIEKKSEKFYRMHAEENTGAVKEILLRLAKEEHGHAIIIENIIDFINKPKTWIEDPEFNNLANY